MGFIIRSESWSKDDFVKLLRMTGCKTGAEIGVFNGEFSRPLARNKWLEKIYLIDPYKTYTGDFSIQDDQSVHDLRYEMVRELFSGTNAEVIRKTSKEAVNDISDESLDFVYIDALHDFDNVLWDIENWSKKVKPNGILAGHDFDFLHLPVVNAVSTYISKHQIKLLTLCERDHIWFLNKETENEQT